VRCSSDEEELEVSYVMIGIPGEKAITEVLISDTLDRVLLGVLTLEAMGFKINARRGELERTELLLL
jgi:predicted aspartyl protease